MSFRLEVLQESVKWAETLYDAANKLSARLEDKAQQSATMAGLFLAAAFGFLKPDNGALVGSHRLVATLLTFTVVIFLLCLAACLSVTWLRPRQCRSTFRSYVRSMKICFSFPKTK